MQIRHATPADAEAISAVARQTFALACPPDTPHDVIVAYIDDNFTAARFGAVLTNAQYEVRVADDAGAVAGFSVINRSPARLGVPAADGIPELSRCYVLAAHHGSGLAQQLMSATLAAVSGPIRLTVSEENAKAIRFYTRNGFAEVGETTFQCGDDAQRDLVMVRSGA
ncbi:GNAT family N-acetyltransferase [Burkholderia sp. Ac-20379]|uniref:GNAT family N-acetyltransferase n=1 Tax=Burkholderia sp. Ac-20379 TaxID=2703900 RepID=UPI00197FCEC0|nr:GNAT family N-acetyltransferase [Burkholderia sp. Ac-20379]